MNEAGRDLVVAGSVAILLHLGLAACLAWCHHDAGMIPEFSAGESSVRLTLLSTPLVVPQEKPSPPLIETLPELPPEPALVPLPQQEPEEAFVEDPEPVIKQVEVAEPVQTELDADSLDKGVEDGEIDSSTVRPRYPLGARLRGEEGLVTLEVEVDATGKARAVRVVSSSGYSALDEAAIKAAWRANYTDSRGGSRAGRTTFGVRFRLED